MANLKFAIRTLFKKSPFVTAIAIVSLALGIGANAAIFSIFNQILLSSLPVHDPDGLVNLGAPGPKPGSTSCNQAGACDAVFSYPMFRDLEREQTTFSGLAAHRSFNVSLAYRGQSMTGLGMLVSGSYFPVLGVQPALGRLLGPGDDRATGESAVAVLSHAYWTSRFAEDPNVLNSLLTINGQQFTVVGVAPRGFSGTTFGALAHVFVPVTMRPNVEPNRGGFDSRRSYWVYVFGRLKPGVSIDAARTQINGPYRAILNDVEVPLQQGMSAETLERFKVRQVTVEEGSRGQSSAHTDAKAPLLILLGVTTLVLLIACANIANLLLARSAARAGEMAVRLSLGASRAQLIGQLLVESCLLAVLGGAAGLLVSRWTLDAVESLLPPEAVNSVQLGVDATVLMFAGALSLATGLLFGLFPALHSTRPDLVSTLKNQAGQPSGARAAARFRTVLATAQIALSMALFVSAGLFIKSLVNISRIDLGLQPDHLVTFNVTPEQTGYPRERSRQFFERLEDALAALPGASSVTAARVPALAGSNTTNSVAVQDFPAGPDTDTNASMNQIAPGYFRTMGIPLIAGREFTRSDTLKTPRVAIVNEAFAKIGLRMALGAAPGRVRSMVLKQVAWMTIVGSAVGLAAAVAVGQLAQSLLYQLKGYDAVVLIASSVALGLVALAAGFIPAMRASRVDPMLALRYE